MARVRKITAALGEVDHSPLEKWVDDFKRDVNPDREIEVWESIARAYTAYTDGKGLTQPVKEDVFQVLLLRSMMSAEEVVGRAKLKALTEKQAHDVMALYDRPAKPVTVVKEAGAPTR